MNPTHRAISLLSNLWFPPHSWLREHDKCSQESGLWLVHHRLARPMQGQKTDFVSSPSSGPGESTAYFPQVAFSGGSFLVT